ncbi:hypothetical protein [Alicyclobacillus sp. SP_1]|nr:hypothetical protein [Alicyclobacillus sp. SP_1]
MRRAWSLGHALTLRPYQAEAVDAFWPVLGNGLTGNLPFGSISRPWY